jgi:DNA primase
MPVIKPTCINDLKMRVNIVDVVSRAATLRKAGNRFKGLCPFHQEKTPSFHVDPDKGFFKCFGCGKAGDIFTFVRETEGLGFTEAVEALGQRFGIVIEYEEGSGGPSREERSLRQEIFDLHEQAAAHFHQAFLAPDATGDFMRQYWTGQRRFPAELAGEFRIGAAGPDGSGLGAFLMRKKFSEAALRQCGLFFVREEATLTLGSLKPRFRGRLMIPIRDHQGRVVAFTARQTGLTPEDDPAREAKYVNSPETPIFTKGNLLFNLDRARTAVGEGHPFVLVEGQLDALRCWQVDLKTAIAPQGTSITEPQLQLIRRYHTQVECFLDSDAAGQKASLRFLPMAIKAGLEVRFLTLAGAGKLDPDLLFLEKGLAGYEELRRSSLSAIAYAAGAFLPNPRGATAEQQSRAAQSIVELIAASESSVARENLLSEASRHLLLPQRVLQQELEAFIARRGRQLAARLTPAQTTPAPGPRAAAGVTPEHELLLMLLHFEALAQPMAEALPHEWIDTGHVAGQLLNRFLAEIAHGNWSGRDQIDPLLETDEERALIASLLFEAPELDQPVRQVVQGLTRLRQRALEPRLRQIELDLANHHADIDSDPISLVKELAELRRQLHQPITLHAAV